MAEIIHCPDCMGKGCSGCNDTGEMLRLDLADMQRAADTLSIIREGQAEHPGQAPRWWLVNVHRGDPEEMQAQARLIVEHPHLCMVDGGAAVSMVALSDLPQTTGTATWGPGPDWKALGLA